MRGTLTAWLLGFSCLLASCAAGRRGELELLAAAPPTADLIVIAERVHALDPRIPAAEAVAIRHGRVLAVSTRSGILRYRGTMTRVEVYEGAHVFPGFGDARVDLVALGRSVRKAGGGKGDAVAESDLEAVLLAAQRACVKAGLTRIHALRLSAAARGTLERLEAEGRWKLGVFAELAVDDPSGTSVEDAISRKAESAELRRRLRFVKAVATGAAGKKRRSLDSALEKLMTRAALALGSNAPTASISLFDALHTMATSASEHERTSAAEALVARTRGVAWAAREEAVRGRIAAGFEADLSIVDRDVTRVPAKAVLAARVLGTLIAGDFAWRRVQ